MVDSLILARDERRTSPSDYRRTRDTTHLRGASYSFSQIMTLYKTVQEHIC